MYKFKLVYENENMINDLNETLRAFYPHVLISDDGDNISLSQIQDGKILISKVEFCGNEYIRKDCVDTTNEILRKRYQKRYLKLLLYTSLSRFLGVELPWGSLTGIRPTKLAYDLLSEGESGGDSLRRDFFVSEERAKLVDKIIETQKGIYSTHTKDVDLYVNIPFCVSRCSYCSFVSALCSDKKKLLLPYAEALSKELACALKIIENKGLNLRAVYCGGGTPTSFSAELLGVVFKDFKPNAMEFTVECGRPDTITEEKLSLLKKIGVTRISINPQTFNQKVLDTIGRSHTVQEIYDAYSLAKNFGLKINMDLIADLPEDTYESFCDSVKRCIDLCPDNITVHTLSIKHSSKMKDENYDNRAKQTDVIRMVDTARNMLDGAGYNPYYMYRQKNTSGNLENIGYAKKGSVCIYNVDIMEETTSIISCGAGGISKRVFHDAGRIERQNIVKNIEQYLREVEEIIIKKERFFD